MSLDGYPQIVVFAVLGVGLTLAVVKPYAAFLLGVLLLAAGHADAFTQTRTELFGPYLNLTDACVLIAITGFFIDRIAARRTIRVPEIVPLVLLVLIVASAQTFWKLGWTYETLRALRWAMSLPLGFFLGANMVTSIDRAKKLIAAVLLGVVLAAIQHVFFVAGVWRSRSLSMENYELMRTIGYSGGRAASFLLTAVIWGLPSALGRKVLCLSIGILLLATIFLNQTRSLWLATVGAVPCLLILFRTRGSLQRVSKFAAVLCVVVLALAAGLQRIMPGLDVSGLVGNRFERLVSDESVRVHMGTRERSFTAEMGNWMEGTMIFGRGLYFFQTIEKAEDAEYKVAFGHLGYVTYLSQLGLTGLLVYGLWLPFGVIRNSRRLWLDQDDPVARYMGLFAGATIIHASLMFVMSSHYLSVSSFVPGLLYGGVWSLATRIVESEMTTDATEPVLQG